MPPAHTTFSDDADDGPVAAPTVASPDDEPSLHHIVHLRPHQSRMLHCETGTRLLAVGGGLWLTEAPRWLGEQLLRPRLRLERHASHVLTESGWVALWAERGAVLQVVPAPAEVAASSGVAEWLPAAVAAAWRWARRQTGRGPARLA